MMSALVAAVALSSNPTVAVASQQWNEASKYDTIISLFPLFPDVENKTSASVILAPEVFNERSIWNAFDRGSSGGFELAVLTTSIDGGSSSGKLVRDLRQLTGLTWQQAADLVGVKPRTLHNWAAGCVIAEKNLRRLGELLAALRLIDRGYADENRDLILSSSADGRTIFSLLKNGEFDRAVATAGHGVGRSSFAAKVSSSPSSISPDDHFGQALASSLGDLDTEVMPLDKLGKRPAQARKKG